MRDYACYTRRSWKNKRVRYLFILESGHNCRLNELPPQFLGCGIKDMIFRVAALSARRLNYISLNYMTQTVYWNWVWTAYNYIGLIINPVGRAMAQAVSRRSLTAEARVHARINPCSICGGQSGTGTGFSPSSSAFPSQYHSIFALQTHIIWGMNNMSVSGSSSET
jgi:hypothetical protein